jgi:FKBP-type peptidyl-prolyl cis-trans isomerase 2
MGLSHLHAHFALEALQAVVTDVTDDHVEIDANPRLAGQPLIFDVELTRCDSRGG